MSDGEEPEYEVESLIAAKVFAASRAKNAKLFWKYLVRWKGYSANDDTWEPVESFEGSDSLVEDFWKRVTTHGRDIKDMSLFRAGDEFRPVGPPRHKPKPKSTRGSNVESIPKHISEESDHKPPSKSALKSPGKRQRPSDVAEPSEMPVKRLRASATKPAQTPVASASSPKLPSESRRSTRSKDANTASARPSTSRRQSQARKPLSPEIIPDSDEGRNDDNLLHMPSAVVSKPSAMTPKPMKLAKKSPKVHQSSPIVIDDDSPPPSPSVAPVQQVEEESASRIPAHRARLANPRVKLVDDSQLASMEGAIPTKMRVAENINAEPSTSAQTRRSATRSKPGPGRSSAGLKNTSSLLTMEKGTLKSVKGKVSDRSGARSTRKGSLDAPADVDAMELDAVVDAPPPSADELLQLAGLNEKAAESLSDFEEDPVDTEANVAKAPEKLAETVDPSTGVHDDTDENLKEQALRKKSLDLAKNSLFPQQQITSSPATMNDWGRSTIFGPMSLGSSANKMEGLSTPPTHLHLDASMTVPILVSEVSAAARLSSSQMLGDTQQAPGKFYQTDAALSLLATVRATGDFAIITVLDNATPEEKNQFELFHKRLEEGEIFVAMAGVQLLVFSSSSNTLLSSRLNAPANLLNQPGNVLVSHVDVQNYSGYAEAASKADTRRWTQYLSST